MKDLEQCSAGSKRNKGKGIFFPPSGALTLTRAVVGFVRAVPCQGLQRSPGTGPARRWPPCEHLSRWTPLGDSWLLNVSHVGFLICKPGKAM